MEAASVQNSDHSAQQTIRKAFEVSVVIPVLNETESLPHLFESLRRQTLPPDEIIIVDGRSSDGTPALARRLAAGDERFQVIEAGEATPGRGRNIGIARARHEWIALTDAGIILEPTWLEQLAKVAERDDAVEVVYGNYEPVADTRLKRLTVLAFIPPKRERPGGRMRAPFIASSLLRRRVWQQVGGFTERRVAEDLIFFESVRDRKLRVGWAPTATVWWQLQPSLAATFRKFTLYSRHNVYAGRKHDWQYGVARQYLLGLVFIAPALLHSLWWLAVPAAGAALRVAKSIWERREGRSLLWALNPLQFLGVGLVILVIDAAMYLGWLQAAWWPQREKHARPLVKEENS